MSNINIEFTSEVAQLVYKNGSLLSYASTGSAGFDLRAISFKTHTLNEINGSTLTISPSQRFLICTGVKTSFDKEYELQIRSRSGIALKNGVFVLNAPGTIDSDYRGEIGVILQNSSDSDFIVKQGDRIAQAVFAKCEQCIFNFTNNLTKSDRGEGGFGSSGTI